MIPSLFERFGIRFYVAFEVHVVAFFYTARVQVVAHLQRHFRNICKQTSKLNEASCILD